MRTTLILLVTLSWAGAFSAYAEAQDPAIVPTRGFHPAHSYSISDIESIDQATGALSLHIPLAQLPPGPAGFTAGISLVYTSRYWETYPTAGSQGGTEYWLVRSAAWRLAYAPWLDVRWLEDPTYCPDGGFPFRLSMVDPDGSSHLLYYNVSPTGSGRYCQSEFNELTTPTVWYSNDGSFLQVEFDAEDLLGSWTLRRNDGTSVRYDATQDKTYLRDRNGNEATVVFYFTDAEHAFTEMEDPFGRKIRIEDTYSVPEPGVPSQLVQSLITQVGHDGDTQTPLTWTITYNPFPGIAAPTTYDCFDDQFHNWNACPLAAIGGGPVLVSSLQLPNGLQYQFQYTARYRELSRLTLPTGATVDYVYWGDAVVASLRYYRLLGNPVTGKTVTYDAGATEAWTYTNSDDGNVFTETRTWRQTIAPDGGTTRHDFFGLTYYILSSPIGGLITKITQPDGSTLEREWDYTSGVANPWVETETEMRANASGTPVTTYRKVFTTDKNGNITSREERDSTTLLRKTVMTYVNGAQDSNYTEVDPNAYSHTTATTPRTLVRLTEAQDPQNPQSPVLSRSEFNYQESVPNRMAGNLHHKFDWDSEKPGTITPCNTPTIPNSCALQLSTSNAIQSEFTYTQRGNLLTKKDPNENQVTYSYSAISDCPNPAADTTDLYRTGIQFGGNGSAVQNWTYHYDSCYSGLLTETTDPNGLDTISAYDRYSRPTVVTEGALRTTRHTYPADGNANLWVVTTADVSANGDQRNVSVSRFDQLGRIRLTQQLEAMTTPESASADESLGIKTETKYVFSSGINAALGSSPYRASDPNASTRGWTVTRRDTAGRMCSVETFDGGAEPSPAQNCAPTSGATGRTVYSYDATATFTKQTITETTTAPPGVIREVRSDVLGRLSTVGEDPGGSNSTTNYGYDLRDNLVSVAQGTTSRTFVYTSLGRLKQATNPETGTSPVAYSYDNAGNLLSRTMGGVTRTSAYDDQHRVLTHSYNDSTPAVTFTYDTAQTGDRPGGCAGDNGPTGRLAKITNGSFTSFYFYNQLSQAVCSRQRIQTYEPFDFLYTPTPPGEWATVKYPSGRTLTTPFDDGGRPVSLAGASSYASNLQYTAHGAVGQVTLGNGTVETAAYNGRLQLTDLKLGSSPGQNGQGTSDRWRLENCYTDTDPCLGSGPGNNGNVRFQRLTVLNGVPVTTVYRYDGLNRLKLANETPTSSLNPLCPDTGSHWCQQYAYDARGNRRVEAESYLGFVIGRPDTFGADNRIADAGFGYDARGNLMLLPTGERYVYDGENRQVVYCASFVSQTDCNNPAVTIGKTFYYYDGEGRRIGKVSGAVTEAFVYDARGNLAAEYGGAAEVSGTQYVTADHLGSTRVITDASKAVLMCKDYLPFGDEILATTQNARIGIACYSGETGLRQKFTGKERDPESRLDYFGARYFSWAQGRFTSPDEFTGGIVDPFTGQQVSQPGPLPYADITDPQTINKYAYVRNNPLRFTDPDGHVIDYLFDAAGIAFDINEIRNDPSTSNFVQLGVDIVLAATPFVPTIGAVKLGGKTVDVTVDAARTAEAATEVKRAVPNPYGKMGGPEHRARVAEVARQLQGKGLHPSLEARIPTPRGSKSARYADVVGLDPKTSKMVEIHQVGKQTKKGQPIARERRAIEDIQKACKKKVCFDSLD